MMCAGSKWRPDQSELHILNHWPTPNPLLYLACVYRTSVGYSVIERLFSRKAAFVPGLISDNIEFQNKYF